MDPSRYARLEDERRFLVAAVPEGATSPRRIEDRYVTGTSLRLRRVTDERGSVLKLGHKQRCDEGRPSTVWHTTMYLDDAEYAMLATLEARTLDKLRWSLSDGGSADELLGALAGLVLIEGDRPFELPPPAVEVTADERFCGDALAALDASGAAALVAEAQGRTR
jgi:CYTH domain-containing protein